MRLYSSEYNAQYWTKASHKTPLKNIPSVDNYDKIVSELIMLMQSRIMDEVTGQLTPILVFCKEDHIEQSRGVLDWLVQKNVEKTRRNIKCGLKVHDVQTKDVRE
jgi:hypothetical protein